jgi:hypothetical protein
VDYVVIVSKREKSLGGFLYLIDFSIILCYIWWMAINHKINKDGKPRKKRDNTARYYWRVETDDIIAKYKETGDEDIFTNELYPLFLEMSQTIYFRFKFKPLFYEGNDHDENIKSVVTHCHHVIKTYVPAKGRSFGYFSTCVKNYYMQRNRELMLRDRHFTTLEFVSDNNGDKDHLFGIDNSKLDLLMTTAPDVEEPLDPIISKKFVELLNSAIKRGVFHGHQLRFVDVLQHVYNNMDDDFEGNRRIHFMKLIHAEWRKRYTTTVTGGIINPAMKKIRVIYKNTLNVVEKI